MKKNFKVDVQKILARAGYKDERVVVTIQGKRRKGVRIDRQRYEQVAGFLISQLQHRTEMQLHELLDVANKHFDNMFKGDLSWFLLIVKNDLEERKIIKIERSVGANRAQLVRLKKTIL